MIAQMQQPEKMLTVGTVFRSAKYSLIMRFGGNMYVEHIASVPVTSPETEAAALETLTQAFKNRIQLMDLPFSSFVKTEQFYPTDFAPHRKPPIMRSRVFLSTGLAAPLLFEIRHFVGRDNPEIEEDRDLHHTVAHKIAFLALDFFNKVIDDVELWAHLQTDAERHIFIQAFPELSKLIESDDLDEYCRMFGFSEDIAFSLKDGRA